MFTSDGSVLTQEMVADSNGRLEEKEFSPLSVRIGAEQKELQEGLTKLKDAMGENDFNQYIENLLSLKVSHGTLWAVTRSERHRSLLERDYLPQLCRAFGTAQVRIISQWF